MAKKRKDIVDKIDLTRKKKKNLTLIITLK